VVVVVFAAAVVVVFVADVVPCVVDFVVAGDAVVLVEEASGTTLDVACAVELSPVIDAVAEIVDPFMSVNAAVAVLVVAKLQSR
jgi:hypothetical protein